MGRVASGSSGSGRGPQTAARPLVLPPHSSPDPFPPPRILADSLMTVVPPCWDGGAAAESRGTPPSAYAADGLLVGILAAVGLVHRSYVEVDTAAAGGAARLTVALGPLLGMTGVTIHGRWSAYAAAAAAAAAHPLADAEGNAVGVGVGERLGAAGWAAAAASAAVAQSAGGGRHRGGGGRGGRAGRGWSRGWAPRGYPVARRRATATGAGRPVRSVLGGGRGDGVAGPPAAGGGHHPRGGDDPAGATPQWVGASLAAVVATAHGVGCRLVGCGGGRGRGAGGGGVSGGGSGRVSPPPGVAVAVFLGPGAGAGAGGVPTLTPAECLAALAAGQPGWASDMAAMWAAAQAVEWVEVSP
ncbi:hypothetical protein MMPV_009318 [Pyropia vietnamensis]